MGNNSNHNNNNNYNNDSNKGSGGSNDNYILPPSKHNLGEVEIVTTRIKNTQSIGGYYFTPQEIILSTIYPGPAAIIMKNAAYAFRVQNRLFIAEQGEDDVADAFRHAFFSAINARDVGVGIAKLFGDAHEASVLGDNLSQKMDLYNNDQGYRIYSSLDNTSNANLIKSIFNHAANGGLKEIINGQLTNTTIW